MEVEIKKQTFIDPLSHLHKILPVCILFPVDIAVIGPPGGDCSADNGEPIDDEPGGVNLLLLVLFTTPPCPLPCNCSPWGEG